jgi:PmbA protein
MSDWLLEKVKRACDLAIDLGADQADAYASSSTRIQVRAAKNSIQSSTVVADRGLSVRAYVDGGCGFAYSMDVSDASAAKIAEDAVSLARVAEPDPDFVSLPEPAQAKAVRGLYDPRVAKLDPRTAVEWMLEAVEAGRAVEPDASMSGAAFIGTGESAISNSLGLEARERSTSLTLYAHAILRDGDEVSSYSEFDIARRLKDFDPIPVGGVAAETARRFMQKKGIETTECPVILGPRAAHSFFGTIAYCADADSAQRRRSFLADKLGERIASDIVTIEDDPTIPGGMGSGEHDGEGVPPEPVRVVEDGTLRTFLHNSYTANKAKTPNNARASRAGYKSTVGISPTNVNPLLGSWDSDELISETKRGVYLPDGYLAPNPITGDVSATIDYGFLIEDGEISHPIKNSMLGGDFLELAQGVDAITKDCRREPGMIMPTLRIRKAKIAGTK